MIWRRKKAAAWVSLLVALLGWGIWQFSPAQAIYAISHLSDPARLATLGERQANPRLNKIVYWLDESRDQGLSPERAIQMAQLLNGTQEPRAHLVKESLLRNVKIADELGLLTDANKDRLRRGSSAQVSRGPYAGEPVEIDHIVPFSLARELGNELANLEMLPKTLNRRKSNHVQQRQLDYALKFFQAGLLRKESLDRVQAKAKSDQLHQNRPSPKRAQSPPRSQKNRSPKQENSVPR